MTSGKIASEFHATSAYFTIQKRIIEDHINSFVGRIPTREAFDRFVTNHSSGYFIVVGGPGDGKTAFACQLVHSLGLPHHLVSSKGGRGDARLILRSLLSQIPLIASVREALPESIPELSKLWEESLATAAQSARVVVVIDGLDELPLQSLDEALYLVNDRLPPNVYFVVTVRPGGRLTALSALVSMLPNKIHELGPLAISEMEEIVRSRVPHIASADLDHIVQASQGNPLSLRAVVDELLSDPRLDIRQLPLSIEGFFSRAIEHLQSGQKQVLRDVLGLLAVARKPLRAPELHGILGHSLRELHEDGIVPILNFLTESEEGYSLYHASFQDFVIRQSLPPAGANEHWHPQDGRTQAIGAD